MFDVKNVEIEWAGRTLKLETGKIARQADSTVIATYGGTTVMCNVVAAKEANPDMDFFPLTVNYQEKYYSVGKIPGGFFKREARPTEKETLDGDEFVSILSKFTKIPEKERTPQLLS